MVVGDGRKSRIKKVCDKEVAALLFWANRCNRRDRVLESGRKVEVPGTSRHCLNTRYEKYWLLILHRDSLLLPPSCLIWFGKKEFNRGGSYFYGDN